MKRAQRALNNKETIECMFGNVQVATKIKNKIDVTIVKIELQTQLFLHFFFKLNYESIQC